MFAAYLVATHYWCLFNRNQMLHAGKSLHYRLLISHAIDSFLPWRSIALLGNWNPNLLTSYCDSFNQWVSSLRQWLKVNVDGRRWGIGAIIVNQTGKIITVVSKKKSSYGSLNGEIEEIILGLRIVGGLPTRTQLLKLESDSEELVKLILKGDTMKKGLWEIHDTIISISKESILHVSHVHQEGNHAAHSCAQMVVQEAFSSMSQMVLYQLLLPCLAI